MTRRDVVKLAGVAALDFFLLVLGGAGYGFLMEPGSLKVEKIRMKLPRLPRLFSGIRIAQISDIHMGGWMNLERFQRVADLVVAQQPDILLITGDFLLGHDHTDISQQAVNDLIAGLSPLADAFPTYAVLGNHDYWTDAKLVRELLLKAVGQA